jgi:hypothetical protein
MSFKGKHPVELSITRPRGSGVSVADDGQRSGLRLPALASSMILMAIAYLTPSSQSPAASFFRRRKSKDEERLFFCERRLRNPHAPRFFAPKIFRGAVAQYLSSRAYRLVTGSFEVREFHSYVVDVGAMIFNMEIVSGHGSAPISTGGSAGLSLPPTPGDHLPVINDNPGVS